MSLNWNFDKRIGSAILGDGRLYTLYRGNALLIALWETPTQYSLAWFYTDKDHLKNCEKNEARFPIDNGYFEFFDTPANRKLASLLAGYGYSINFVESVRKYSDEG